MSIPHMSLAAQCFSLYVLALMKERVAMKRYSEGATHELLGGLQ